MGILTKLKKKIKKVKLEKIAEWNRDLGKNFDPRATPTQPPVAPPPPPTDVPPQE